MAGKRRSATRSFKGIMISSTGTDLMQHRAALFGVVSGQELKAVAMEDDSAKADADVLDSSLEMVNKSAAYVLVIGQKYGRIPNDARRNPNGLSLTELEYEEAVRIGLPILLFLMGPDHPLKAADVETDPDKRRKLDAFRERAKLASPGVERVYKVFNSLHELEVAATKSIAKLRSDLGKQDQSSAEPPPATPGSIPEAPELYAEPRYAGSHQFIGRKAQLETLNEWAAAADPNPILLFEAIGGAGKSILTWEWTNRYATTVRPDWAGRFWYSFYEKGAVMADFCRRALAYTTGKPLSDFRKKRTPELSELLLRELRRRPWLFVLDGLERVLVAYHRFDAAQVADEDAGSHDEIAQRDPCAAIRPEDDQLLRELAAGAPSKLLITSRLLPRVLLNPSNQPIPGVRRESLPGLLPADAEALVRSCGVTGDSKAIQEFLKTHCDCHPLVTGVLAGLINDYLPARGDFDAWAAADDGGAALNLAELNLVQKRNHILRTAIERLSPDSRKLLSMLAVLSEGADYELLTALNPHLPPKPEEAKDPGDVERVIEKWRKSKAFRDAPGKLKETVLDLERRGLLQYDNQDRRYDLHPVVRGVAAGDLSQEDRILYGQRVVDHFAAQSHGPYEEAETLDDLRPGLNVVRTLLQMGRTSEATQAYRGGLSDALLFNLEAYATVLALLRPLFSRGWGNLPQGIGRHLAAQLANTAGVALRGTGEFHDALTAYGTALESDLAAGASVGARTRLSNVQVLLREGNRIAASARHAALALRLAEILESRRDLFRARLHHFVLLVSLGRWPEAEETWALLDPMGRDWSRTVYRSGTAELYHAVFHFSRGTLHEEHLLVAEQLARRGRDRSVIRQLHRLRGRWLVLRREWARAADSLEVAVRMARETAQADPLAEAQLALANFHLGRFGDPREEAERLSRSQHRSDAALADLWLAIGDREEAKKHALAAYKWAWADGEPYVRRYDLDRATELLRELGTDPPILPPYDPAADPKFPWEDKVEAFIEQLEKEQK